MAAIHADIPVAVKINGAGYATAQIELICSRLAQLMGLPTPTVALTTSMGGGPCLVLSLDGRPGCDATTMRASGRHSRLR